MKVYIWGFPCLDYSFDVLVSWSRNLKPYNQIARPDYCYDNCYDYCYDSCLSSGYDSYYTCYGLLIFIVMYSCLDIHMICNSDSIRLDISVAWDIGIYMRVSLFGLFLRCTSLMGPWPKRIKSILLISALLWISCFMMLMLYPFIYTSPVF